MDINCEQLRDIVSGFSLVHQCDVVKNGMLRISTPFNYPNGSQIDLFLYSSGGLFNGYILSDYGMTADYLLDMQIKFWATKKRKLLIEDICEALKVEHHSGVLQVSLQDDLSDLSMSIVRLAQACIRVTDLSFTQRLQISGTFQEDVEEFIATAELPYESDVELVGSYGKVVRVNFRVIGKTVTSLVQTLSFSTIPNAHIAANEVFRKWWDLRPHHNSHQFLTLYDAQNSTAIKEEDIERIGEFSTILTFPDQQEEIQEALAA
jgi:Domain of unknown function DUF1828